MLEIMWDAYKIKPILYDSNIVQPTVPMTKIGPDVVQKMDIFFASDSEMRFLLYRSEMIFEPIGYPDKMLIKNAYNDMPGVPKSICENLLHLFVSFEISPISVKSFVRNINGNSPGITLLINKFKPSIVALEYLVGFAIIKIIMENIEIEKKKS